MVEHSDWDKMNSVHNINTQLKHPFDDVVVVVLGIQYQRERIGLNVIDVCW